MAHLDPWKDRPKEHPDQYCRICQFKKTQCHCKDVIKKRTPAKGTPMPKLSSSDIEFASWMVNYLCDHPGPGSGSGAPPKIQETMANLTKAMSALPPKCAANLYRKQYGNLSQIINTQKFDFILQVHSSVLMVAPAEHLQASMDHGYFSVGDFARVAEMREAYMAKRS